ncbi:UNVERIFIED_CONTAM: hypothetical protein FKN15_040979 [Acipenser sinensis]
MNPRCTPKRVPSAARFFTRCRLTLQPPQSDSVGGQQPPQSYSVGGQRSSGQLTSPQEPGLTTGGALVSRGHPGRPKNLLAKGATRDFS